ncbi:conserved hypothetical protein [Lebetimonas natsushimae]|uniref:SPOR domain-containing protein n=1 Tax=Lebetimonas natsushimae TaxID=1936991 RepID=A0A292YB50_9BACT|nr:hypothetical protein [Lebetimonas natsushimae]GAX88192.1 conserved hypothetical protein [Lebetimonas natsushimae]
MKIIISFLTILIFALLILTYVKISKPNVSNYELKKNEINLSKLKSKESLNFTYKYNALPARVLYEKINFKNIKTVIFYKLIIKNDDKFALFNILEILKSKKITYSMIKQKNTQIFVIFRSLKEAEDILNLFKFYNFPVKLQKFIKRI